MGAVYQAIDRSSGQPVALKVLCGVASVERFEVETEILARLRHPGIVSYVAHGNTAAGEPYLAMEWLAGLTLRQSLSNAPFGVRSSVVLGRAVADALSAAHGAGIIHRDLKPSNLFLCDGQPERVKVLDFGIARFGAWDRELTLTNQIVGTPGYMAPEQARGVREITAQADLFSLGCVLYRCITGQAAFPGDDLLSVLAKLVVYEPPPIDELCGEAPDQLVDLIARLLQKSPAARPASAAAVQQELDHVLSQLEGTAIRVRRPPSADGKSSEARLSSVIIASQRQGSRPVSEADLERLRAEIGRSGGTLAPLAGGALVVSIQTRGSPQDHAETVARCAQVLAQAIEGVQMSVAFGHARAPGEQALAIVIDKASRLLGDAAPGSVRVQRSQNANSMEETVELLLHEQLSRVGLSIDQRGSSASMTMLSAQAPDQSAPASRRPLIPWMVVGLLALGVLLLGGVVLAIGGFLMLRKGSDAADARAPATSAPAAQSVTARPVASSADAPDAQAIPSGVPRSVAPPPRTTTTPTQPASRAFDRAQAKKALAGRAALARLQCSREPGPRLISASVTFGNDGRARRSSVPASIAANRSAICVKMMLVGAHVPRFDGPEQSESVQVSLTEQPDAATGG
jgi:hypothetical protein